MMATRSKEFWQTIDRLPSFTDAELSSLEKAIKATMKLRELAKEAGERQRMKEVG